MAAVFPKVSMGSPSVMVVDSFHSSISEVFICRVAPPRCRYTQELVNYSFTRSIHTAIAG
jgi:hypothetical protein